MTRRRRSSYGQSSDSYDASGPGSSRVAHNLVERKYRDGLNAELNRLRLVLPHIGSIRQPTKAQILASAANYIEELKETCDRLQNENETLLYGGGGSGKAKRHRRSA
jgi:Helix-loop-helix DNA-binding domain